VLEQEQSQHPVSIAVGSLESLLRLIIWLLVVGAALDPLELQKVLERRHAARRCRPRFVCQKKNANSLESTWFMGANFSLQWNLNIHEKKFSI